MFFTSISNRDDECYIEFNSIKKFDEYEFTAWVKPRTPEEIEDNIFDGGDPAEYTIEITDELLQEDIDNIMDKIDAIVTADREYDYDYI